MMSDASLQTGATAPAPTVNGLPIGGGATDTSAPSAQLDAGTSAPDAAAKGTTPDKAPAEGVKPIDEGAQAPETYELKMPEGVQLDSDAASEFTTIAKDLKLSAADAQRIADIGAKMQQRQVEQQAAVVKGWLEQCNTDKEFGGDKLKENVAVARTAIDNFGSPELKVLLDSSGLGNHPEFIRFAFRAGKAISQDGFIRGNGAQASPVQNHADKLYGGSK